MCNELGELSKGNEIFLWVERKKKTVIFMGQNEYLIERCIIVVTHHMMLLYGDTDNSSKRQKLCHYWNI